MLRSLFGFDWRKSPAHLLFLSKFRRPRATDDFAGSDVWKTALKEDANKAMKRFLDEGFLEQAGLGGLLNYRYKVSELKAMLRKRNLPVSGRKADLIERLVQADPKAMRKAVHGLRVLQCTEKGEVIAEEHLAQEREKRADVEELTLQALRQRRFKEAARAVAAFEAQQVFQRGIGVDWENYDHTRDVAVLRIISEARPRILAQLDQETLEPLRLAAGMMHLWGTNKAGNWIPADLETDLFMNNDAAARMLSSYALYQMEMEDCRKSPFVKSVEIYTCNDEHVCAACRKLASKKHSLKEVPELPYENCTSELGCRCSVVGIPEP